MVFIRAVKNDSLAPIPTLENFRREGFPLEPCTTGILTTVHADKSILHVLGQSIAFILILDQTLLGY
jgi:hypothetical protein